MRKALVVGIDHYEHINCLNGAVNDATNVRDVLERNADGSVNFVTPQLLAAVDPSSAVSRRELKDAVLDLFAGEAEIALFYFSGHGYIEDTGGGFLCASDCRDGDDGLSLAELIAAADRSKAQNKVIILDSCHSGVAGSTASHDVALVSDGMTILTASTAEQYAMESGGSGVFTDLLVDALEGGAANLLGAVTPGSVYAHIDQSLGPWKQRPVFKTNVKKFVSLRTATAAVQLADLQQLAVLFAAPDAQFPLDPSYEPLRTGAEDGSVPPPDPINTTRFGLLQRLQSVGLVRPVGASRPHMWDAAMESKGCELTALGRHYWRLAKERLL
ncbi:caspase family protein [Georgenia daeguensis]|uniref:Caspase family protein n=1 Tax=Georgenia daeguensis TaxID=908355 RepID=A0ABP6UR55_9MICO